MKKPAAIALILLLHIFVSAQQSNQFYIDSFRRELSWAKEDTNKVHLLSWLSNLYFQSYADTATVYAQEALDLAKKIHFKGAMTEMEGSLAISLIVSGNYPLGLDHAYKTLALAKENDPLRIPWAISLVAYCYYYLGDYETFLSYIREASKVAAVWELPYAWRDYSLIFHSLNQPDSALLYGKKAYEKMKGSPPEANIAHILADAYAGKSRYDSALSLYWDGISLSQKNQLEIDLIDSYNGIANVYKTINRFDSAIWYSKKVLNAKIERAYPIGLLKATNMLADAYQSTNQPDSTLKYLRTALQIKDSLFSHEKTMAIQNIAYKEQEKQKEIEASKVKYQNRLKMYLLLGGLLALLAVAGTLWRSNRNRQKAYLLLQDQKQETDRQKLKVEEALSELKSAQAQLIQSEKMASLGELTAGIAHEIQNPLNFVNNFSEVSRELIEELKSQKSTLKREEQEQILDDIDTNLEKIHHHGKRADAIVKGMLQHSRSSGIKEATNLNALTDEYLRLAYHGLRARDKTFNVTLKTDYDEGIGNINIVPQDIGRAILNLLTNAFYACNERSRSARTEQGRSDMTDKTSSTADGTYEPTVMVSTKRVGDKISIVVKDNGPGISQSALDKIFQPFFTTKPTGQGTGLGLSLSYDIIKTSGGKILVDTVEGEGTAFTILLPVEA